jgi:hypothetical protein
VHERKRRPAALSDSKEASRLCVPYRSAAEHHCRLSYIIKRDDTATRRIRYSILPIMMCSKEAEGDQGEADVDEVSMCELCSDVIELEMAALTLSCNHVFCVECARRSFEIAWRSKKKTFHHLFCPFRCGACFDTSANLPADLRAIVEERKVAMEQAKILTLHKAEADGLVTEAVRARYSDLVEFAMEKYSLYVCHTCENLFPLRSVCGPAAPAAGGGNAGDEEEAPDDPDGFNYYCSNCTVVGGERERIEVWRDTNKKVSSTEDKEAVVFLCDSDDNAMAQQCEIEVLLSIYADEIQMLTPAPSSEGDPCASFIIKAPRNIRYDRSTGSPLNRASDRIGQELSFEFQMTPGYPATEFPVLILNFGTLSFAELDLWMRESVRKRMVRVELTASVWQLYNILLL